jgi:hypothetical protein
MSITFVLVIVDNKLDILLNFKFLFQCKGTNTSTMTYSSKLIYEQQVGEVIKM